VPQKILRKGKHISQEVKSSGNNQDKLDRMQQNKVLEILTSFTKGVEELPKISVCSSPAPTLSLFGEGARGLGGGVDVSTIR
jgi:hypothetical protein